jgi:glutathione S-transferase
VSYEFDIQRLIDASPEAVFDAMTDPAAQREWWTGADDVEAECDLRVGGSSFVEWTTDDGHRCRAEQTYVEVVRPDRLVLRETVYEHNVTPYECVLSFTFEDRDGKTLLRLRHTGFPTDEERSRHERGTQIFLDRLGGYLASPRV